jgi:cell division transport system permease protein
MRASFLMSGVVTGLRRNVSMTIALVLSTAISLAFLGGAFLINKEISRFKAKYENKISVNVYLCQTDKTQDPNTTCAHKYNAAEKQAIQTKLNTDSRITSLSFLTEDQATELARKQIGTKIVDEAGPGVFPASFLIKLKDIKKDFAGVETDYAKQAGVASVQNQDDSLKTMLNLFDAAQLGAFVVSIIVMFAAVLQMANTIQVAAQQRRNETGIMRLVGASRWMTQLPFILEAVLAAVVGAVLAIIMDWVAVEVVLHGVFAEQVRNQILPSLDFNDVLVAGGTGLIAGIVLAAATAWVTLRMYVRL